MKKMKRIFAYNYKYVLSVQCEYSLFCQLLGWHIARNAHSASRIYTSCVPFIKRHLYM